MRWATVALLLATSCAPAYRYSPVARVMIEDSGSPIADIDLARVILVYESVLRGVNRHQFSAAVARTKFRFIEGTTDGHLALGEDGAFLIEVASSSPCLARSSLIHELTHLYQLASDDVVDRSHSDDRYWSHGLVEKLRMHIARLTCEEM